MSLEEIDKTFCLHTYNRNYVHFTSGKGARLFTSSGADYIDFTSGIGVASIGHGNAGLAKALYEQAAKLIHTSNLFLIEPQSLLAQKMVELSGFDMRVFFANSGAEANEGAIKIARKYGETGGKKRYKIVTLDSSFHGRTISSLKATGQEAMHKSCFSPYPDGFVYAADLGDVKNVIDDDTVAVMIELIQGEGGVSAFARDAVQDLAAFLRARDILLIVDEVQTGIYRTGEFLASKAYGIAPDIISVAKGLGGGVPIGAVMTNRKDIFAPGDHGSTFGGNFLSTRAGLFVLEVLEKEKDSGALDLKIQLFENGLKQVLSSFKGIFSSLHGLGLMRGLEAKMPELQKAVIDKAFENGLLVLKSGKNRVRFLPCITISVEEIEEGFKRLYAALKTI